MDLPTALDIAGALVGDGYTASVNSAPSVSAVIGTTISSGALTTLEGLASTYSASLSVQGISGNNVQVTYS